MMVCFILIVKALLECSIITLTLFTIAFVVVTVTEEVKTYYEKLKIKKRIQQLEKEAEEWLQHRRKRELKQKLRKEEKEKYPLFYWKENINGSP